MEKVLPENKPIHNFEIEDDFPGFGRRVFNLNAQDCNLATMLIGCFVFIDITDRKQRERDAQMLTNEISHRIKNNLQIVAGLIAHEARSTATSSIEGYKALQARIGAIAALYDLISKSGRGETIDVSGYLKEIAKTMSASLLGNASKITIEVESEALDIDPDHAVPFGLLVNELGDQCHQACISWRRGADQLCAKRVGDQIELTVSDDGVGMLDR